MELHTRTTKGRPVEHQPRKADLPPTYPKGYACNPSPRFRILGSAEELEELMAA